MNRAERRKAIKKGVTAADLHHMTLAERKNSIDFTVDAYSAAVAMVLYDKLGFGRKKIVMTLKQIENLFDSISGDYITVRDMQNTLLEELDIQIGKGWGESK